MIINVSRLASNVNFHRKFDSVCIPREVPLFLRLHNFDDIYPLKAVDPIKFYALHLYLLKYIEYRQRKIISNITHKTSYGYNYATESKPIINRNYIQHRAINFILHCYDVIVSY